MGMWIFKIISLAGVLFIIVLMLRKQKQMAASTEKDPVTGLTFNETWAKGMEKKNLIAIIIIVIVCYLTSLLFFHDAIRKGEAA